MTRAAFLRSLLLCAATPAVVSRALSIPAKTISRTIWFAQTEDGQLHGGRLVWDDVGCQFVPDKLPMRRIIGAAFYEPPIATPANGWGQFAPRSPVRCYGSLRLRRL